jgi:SAM-dependent MidA family methyltransferase
MSSLPQPNADGLAHSERLTHLIKSEIDNAGGTISFAQFMQQALYAPGLGYYVSGNHKFGATGDFVTAPEISALFSQALANQCQQILTELGEADILEFGAGSGVMMADILLRLESIDALPSHYFILEISPELQQRQQATLELRAPHLKDKVEWLSALPEKFKGVILANEVLDAMPVERFSYAEESMQQERVDFNDGKFNWQQAPITEPRLQAGLKNLQEEGLSFATNYTSEINLQIKPWLQSLSDCLQKGVILLIDYGYPRREYYHPQYNKGTLRCFYRHQVHGDVFSFLGLQDITAHVDFTAVAEAAIDSGLDVIDFTTQAVFLLNNGILGLSQVSEQDNIAKFNIQQQLKQLTLPNEMGELFKVIGLGKNYTQMLNGFNSNSLLHLL